MKIINFVKTDVVSLVARIILVMICLGLAFPTNAAVSMTPELKEQLRDLTARLIQYQSQFAPLPQVLGVRTVMVQNSTELATALINAQGGDVIQLAPGYYGSVSMRGGIYNQLAVNGVKYSGKTPSPSSPVTITSQNPSNPAVFSNFTIGTSNWIIDTLAFQTPPAKENRGMVTVSDGVQNVIVKNSTFMIGRDGESKNWTIEEWKSLVGGVALIVGIKAGGEGTIIENNYVKNIQYAIEVTEGSKNVIVRRNTINGFVVDGVRALGNGTVVEDNLIKNTVQLSATHNDCIQSWSRGSGGGVGTGEVMGLRIRGNLCIANENPNHPFPGQVQGVGFFDGMFRDAIIENNIILSDIYHGIALYGAIDSVVKNNTVIDIKSGKPGPTWILVRNHKNGTPSRNVLVENNVTNVMSGATTTITRQNNFIVPFADYSKVFRDISNFDATIIGTTIPAGVGATVHTVGSALAEPMYRVVPTTVSTTTPATPTPSTPVVPVPTVTLTLSSSEATIGSTVTLNWSSTNATTCSASGNWSGVKSVSGSESVTVQAGATTFTLSCTGAGGTQNVTQNLTGNQVVSPVVPAPENVLAPIVRLQTSTTSIKVGTSVTLTWSSERATSCLSSNAWRGTKSLQGTQTVVVSKVGTHKYTVTCTNGTKSTSASVTIVATSTPGTAIAPSIENRVYTTDTVNVRSSANGTKIGTQPRGAVGYKTSAVVTAGSFNWVKVDFTTGQDGYVAVNFLSTSATSTSAFADTQAKINELLKLVANLQLMLNQLMAGQ